MQSEDIEQEPLTEVSNVQPAEARLSFITDPRKHNLAKMLKSLDKNVDEALLLLTTIMNDDSQDAKLRVSCAKEILDKKVAVSTEINKEMLSRTVAESRMLLMANISRNKGPKQVEDEDGEEQSVPVFVPDMILDHSKIREM